MQQARLYIYISIYSIHFEYFNSRVGDCMALVFLTGSLSRDQSLLEPAWADQEGQMAFAFGEDSSWKVALLTAAIL